MHSKYGMILTFRCSLLTMLMVCTLLPGKKSYGALKIFRLCFLFLRKYVGFLQLSIIWLFLKIVLKRVVLSLLPQFIECWEMHFGTVTSMLCSSLCWLYVNACGLTPWCSEFFLVYSNLVSLFLSLKQYFYSHYFLQH